MALLGSMIEFDPINDDWIIYQERLEQSFDANLIADVEAGAKRRAASLLSLIGADTYKLLRDLCYPELPKEKTYEQLCELLKDHFSPKVSIYRERIKFYSAVQSLNENVGEWHARIKKLAVNCKFGTILNKILRDKFVTGMCNNQVLDKLCEDEFSDQKSLNDLLHTALTKEASLQARGAGGEDVRELKWTKNGKFPARSMQTGSKGSASYNPKNSTYSEKNQHWKTTEERSACKSCGRIHHQGQICRFKDSKCFVCNSRGHISSVCEKKRYFKRHNYVDVDQECSDVGSDVEIALHNLEVNRDKKIDPIIVNIKIGSKVVSMEVDSGAAISVISKELYVKQFKHCNLEPSNIILREFTGTKSKPLGYFTANVEYENETKEINIYVVENGGTALLGRN